MIKRSQKQAFAKIDERRIDLRERQSHANYDGRAGRRLITHGAINEIKIESLAVTNGIALARGKRALNFRTVRMILHRLGIVGGIFEYSPGTIDHGDARATLCHPNSPGMKLGGVVKARRIGLGNFQER